MKELEAKNDLLNLPRLKNTSARASASQKTHKTGTTTPNRDLNSPAYTATNPETHKKRTKIRRNSASSAESNKTQGKTQCKTPSLPLIKFNFQTIVEEYQQVTKKTRWLIFFKFFQHPSRPDMLKLITFLSTRTDISNDDKLAVLAVIWKKIKCEPHCEGSNLRKIIERFFSSAGMGPVAWDNEDIRERGITCL